MPNSNLKICKSCLMLSTRPRITFNEKGEAIDNANKIDQGQIVVTQLAKGKFKSRVEN